MSVRPFTLTVLAVVVVLLSGCQNGPASLGATPVGPPAATTAPPGATTVDPTTGDTSGACDLVTADDVSTATGIPMTRTSASVYDCAFAGADQSLQLLVRVFSDQVNMNNLIQQLGSISENVDGLGDQAFWNGITGTMFVRKGDRGFTISTTGLLATSAADIDGPKAGMVALATIALSHF